MTFWSWMVWPNRSMNTARRLGCRVLGLTFTYRWVAQHTASCPLAGAVSRVLPTCAQGIVEPRFRCLGEGENGWSSSRGLVLLLLILVTALLAITWIHIRKEHRHSGQRPSRSAVYFPSRGRARWVRETALDTVTTSPIFQECVFLFPLFIFLVESLLLLF